MKKQVLFIHSAGSQRPSEGSSQLVAYLQSALGKEYEIIHPPMPEPENPRYESWKQRLAEELAIIGDEVILVGHSLGGSVLLKYLSEEGFPRSIAGLFLVSAAYWGNKDWEIEEYIMQPDFASHLPYIPGIFLYHSLDDEWVPFVHLAYYAAKLPQACVRILQGNEHEFYYGLPELVKDIKNLERSKV